MSSNLKVGSVNQTGSGSDTIELIATENTESTSVTLNTASGNSKVDFSAATSDGNIENFVQFNSDGVLAEARIIVEKSIVDDGILLRSTTDFNSDKIEMTVEDVNGADTTTVTHTPTSIVSIATDPDNDNTLTTDFDIETLSITDNVNISGITATNVIGNIEPDFPTNPAILGQLTTITYGDNVVIYKLEASPLGSALTSVTDGVDLSTELTQNAGGINWTIGSSVLGMATYLQATPELLGIDSKQVILAGLGVDITDKLTLDPTGSGDGSGFDSYDSSTTDHSTISITPTSIGLSNDGNSGPSNAIVINDLVTLSSTDGTNTAAKTMSPEYTTNSIQNTAGSYTNLNMGIPGLGASSEDVVTTRSSSFGITPEINNWANTLGADYSRIDTTSVQTKIEATDGTNISTIITGAESIASNVTDGTVESNVSVAIQSVDLYSLDGTGNQHGIGIEPSAISMGGTDGVNTVQSLISLSEVAQSITNGTNTATSSFMPGEYTVTATDGSTTAGIGVTSAAGISSTVSGALVTSTIVQNASNITETAETIYNYAGSTSMELTNTSVLFQSPEINLDGVIGVTDVVANLNFPSTLPGGESELTVAYPGAVVGDKVVCGFPSFPSGGMYMAFVSASNTITVRFYVYGVSTVDPAAADFKFVILK